MASSGAPLVTLTTLSSDGSSTTTICGCSIPEYTWMGSSLTRVKATMGAPERSGPYSGNAWKYLPWPRASSATILAAVTAPWPPRACQRISVSLGRDR